MGLHKTLSQNIKTKIQHVKKSVACLYVNNIYPPKKSHLPSRLQLQKIDKMFKYKFNQFLYPDKCKTLMKEIGKTEKMQDAHVHVLE